MSYFLLRVCVVFMWGTFIGWGFAFVPGSCIRRQVRSSQRCLLQDITDRASQRRSNDPLSMMGAAGKKKKKLEKEDAKGGLSKTVIRETQREAEVLADALVEKCKADKLNLGGINADISALLSRAETLKPSQSVDLVNDWRMVFASDDDALAAIGTGLHRLPLTRMLDFFLTLSGGNVASRRIRAIEVLRVLGPFPNIRNTLTGDCKSTGPTSMNFRYTSLVDGTGKATSSAKGDKDRVVDVEVAFVGQGALVLETKGSTKSKAGRLVFAKEPDIDAELANLRVQEDKL